MPLRLSLFNIPHTTFMGCRTKNSFKNTQKNTPAAKSITGAMALTTLSQNHLSI
jgi:hypothetical protein